VGLWVHALNKKLLSRLVSGSCVGWFIHIDSQFIDHQHPERETSTLLYFFFLLVEVLKLAQWEHFFTEFHSHCQKLLPDSPDYFGSIANLLLLKLVKSVPTSKPITQESIGYLRGFVDFMSTNASLTGSGMDHEDNLASLASMLNFGSALGLKFANCGFYILLN